MHQQTCISRSRHLPAPTDRLGTLAHTMVQKQLQAPNPAPNPILLLLLLLNFSYYY